MKVTDLVMIACTIYAYRYIDNRAKYIIIAGSVVYCLSRVVEVMI